MLDFLKIFGLAVVGVIAFMIFAMLGFCILLMIWPIVVLALPVILITYCLYLIAKLQKKTKRIK